ncbi:uncharacterized protein LOC120211302 [Hibiscus syriacus]|uniref:uncharacterized protein LOC120211302 n=1 Tax=Hibiscus syriacus TaxID=106335 RepID=UPI00192373F8|nr:uncharacterized protein LOC120211302 [Hibiscus syriacus]
MAIFMAFQLQYEAIHSYTPVHYMVGDEDGWDPVIRMEGWTQGKDFHAGDALEFVYDRGIDVSIVDKEAHEDCSVNDTSKEFSTGDDSITLAFGVDYFIYSKPDICRAGLKVAINASAPPPSHCKLLVKKINSIPSYDKEVEQLYSHFFSKGADVAARGARVNWRNILTGEVFFWMTSLKEYMLKGVKFCQIEIPTNISWSFKKILKLRPETHRLVADVGVSLMKASRIWDKLRVEHPKFLCLIVWMAILDHLPTNERLLRIGVNVGNDLCVIYGCQSASRDHIFFHYGFAKELWEGILILCGLPRRASFWELKGKSLLAMVFLAGHLKGKSLLAMVLKLAWGCHMYSVWEERNCRHFWGTSRLVDNVL